MCQHFVQPPSSPASASLPTAASTQIPQPSSSASLAVVGQTQAQAAPPESSPSSDAAPAPTPQQELGLVRADGVLNDITRTQTIEGQLLVAQAAQAASKA